MNYLSGGWRICCVPGPALQEQEMPKDPGHQPVGRVGVGGWGCAAIKATQPVEPSVATASNVPEKVDIQILFVLEQRTQDL